MILFTSVAMIAKVLLLFFNLKNGRVYRKNMEIQPSLFGFDDVLLITVAHRPWTHSYIMRSEGFYWSSKYNNWGKRFSYNDHTKYKVEIVTKRVNDKIKESTKNYKLLENTVPKTKLFMCLSKHDMPSDLCIKICKSVPNICKCKDYITCADCKYACCKKAVPRWCVCIAAYSCVDHGHTCNGSHD